MFRLTARPRFRRDLKLHCQTEDALDSVCRNIAEGFGCETHREFSRFLKISRRSLNELQDGFESALEKGLVSEDELKVPRRLVHRLVKGLSGLIAYLDRTPNQRNRPRTEPADDRGNGGSSSDAPS